MINFVLDPSPNYALVQHSLLELIRCHLPEGACIDSVRRYRPKRLNFALFVRENADVVMSHGAADKNYLTGILDEQGLPYLKRFRHVLVPGEWLKRKMLADTRLGLTEAQVHAVGWPRLDFLRLMAAERPAAPAATQKRRPRVLWAPTHDFVKKGAEQQSTSSYPAFAEHLPILERHCDVDVSLHPRNRQSKKPTDQALLEADVVVSDFGTMVYEAWALGKPVIFPRWLLGDRLQAYLPGSAEAHIFEQRLGHHPGSMEELLAIVQGRPGVSPEVHAFMDDYLLNHRDGLSGPVVAATLLRLAEARQAAQEATPASGAISAERVPIF